MYHLNDISSSYCALEGGHDSNKSDKKHKSKKFIVIHFDPI